MYRTSNAASATNSKNNIKAAKSPSVRIRTSDLPHGAQVPFRDSFVPTLRLLYGLGDYPWAPPESAMLQKLCKRFLPEIEAVDASSLVYKLVCVLTSQYKLSNLFGHRQAAQRLSDWRAPIGAAGIAGLENFFKTSKYDFSTPERRATHAIWSLGDGKMDLPFLYQKVSRRDTNVRKVSYFAAMT